MRIISSLLTITVVAVLIFDANILSNINKGLGVAAAIAVAGLLLSRNKKHPIVANIGYGMLYGASISFVVAGIFLVWLMSQF